MRHICFGILAFGIVSCADINKSGQLERIDALNATLDSIETIYNENKIDTISVISNRAWQVENRIKQNYVSDTINMELGKKMDAFKLMRKQLTPMSKSGTTVFNGIAEEREKLKELYNDIENGNGKRDKYDEYIAFESGKVEQIRAVFHEFLDTRSLVLTTYDEFYDELNEFSLSLMNKKEQ